ncbi:MAG TPA: hypothetical protein ENG87_01615 [Candidatus Pacearchaeota archaeon]|nr:hypothetical protein BMS3Abin17_01226 [archaeon BMS3Abin17]HDK42049.1 hypothetical protein [Candidatus Pacearchaeota archaeon]HDZ60686.1 hypothetical protein [Candidatus Pacearchaeota archaeon]
MSHLLIENKELIKIFYGLIIAVICIFIVYRSDKLFRISMHKGIRYFRNAFLFYGLAFIIRYLFGAMIFYNYLSQFYSPVINILFEFFLVMAGFFLLYSLLWKKIETTEENYYTSLFNSKIAIFYFMSLMIVLLDYLWGTHGFMFVSQIILFAVISIVSYINYIKKGGRHRFLKFYLIAMLFSFAAWVMNFITAVYLNWNQALLINVYILNMLIFLLFLWGVVKVTKK